MSSFDTWLNEESTSSESDEGYVENCNGATGIPVTPDNFHGCITYWAQEVGETSILSRDNMVEIMILPFASRVRYDSYYQVLRDEYNLIEDWMSSQDAPAGADQAFFSSYDFWWYDTVRYLVIWCIVVLNDRFICDIETFVAHIRFSSKRISKC